MTAVIVIIGGHTVSDNVFSVDTWGNKVTQIGTCTIVIDNTSDQWGDNFEPNDAIAITVGGVQIWAGFVDDVLPTLGKRGVNTNMITVKGRDYGRYLTDYQYTKEYPTQASGAIIDNILAGVGDPLLYTNPGGTPSIKYNCQRTKLGTAFTGISALAGYDYYIDITGRLQYFVAGASDSGVDLISNTVGVANNLLNFTEGEEIGHDIKNIMDIHAGSVKDHWTEETAASYGNLVGVTAVTDETTIFMYGAASIKAVAVGNNVTFGMDFTGDLHGYTTIDMSNYGQAKVVFIPETGSTGDFSLRPVLEDGGGNVITFTRNSSNQGSKGFTENYNAGLYKWRSLSFPIGLHRGTEIQAAQKSGWWNGDVAFDWTDVVKIGFQLITAATMDTIFIDALYLPSVEARCSTTRGAASIGLYDPRTLSEYRKQLRSQKELDDYAAKLLEFSEYPIQTFKAVASGQTGTKYVSQIVDVQAPTHGIAALTPYIIISIHHSIQQNKNIRGYDYITEYDLVADETDPRRAVRNKNYFQAYLLQQAREAYNAQRATSDDEYWLGDIMTGYTPQLTSGVGGGPTDANVGDRFYDTALEIEYEYDGAGWVPLILSPGAVTIEMQPWTANFSLIWDDWDSASPGDYNHFKWGLKDQENAANATIAYGDGTSEEVNFGQDAAVADGTWWVYWDTAQVDGAGHYNLQWSTTYSDAVGSGKGVLAQVLVDDATPLAPTVLLYNSYTPTIGAGSIVAYTIQSRHISADWITGKRFRTANNATRVYFDANGILGLNGGVTQFSLASATGKATAGAGAVTLDVNGVQVKGKYLELEDAGSANDGFLWMNGDDLTLETDKDILIQAVAAGSEITIESVAEMILRSTGSTVSIIVGADTVVFNEAGDIVFHDDFDALRPANTGGVDLGTSAKEWGKVYADNGYFSTRLRIPVGVDMFG